MAQRLQESHSPGLCVRYSKRHSRLSMQVPGMEFLTDPIKAAIAEVEAGITAKKVAIEEKDACYDSIGFKDALLDNVVRRAAARSKEFDQSNPGARTYELLFPENTSELINQNPAEEASEVIKVVTRIESLGETHQLFPLAAELKAAALQVEQAVKAHLDSVTALGTIEAKLQIAKSSLIRQYLSNIFEAEKRLGRKFADRLFPKITNRINGTEDDEPETNN